MKNKIIRSITQWMIFLIPFIALEDVIAQDIAQFFSFTNIFDPYFEEHEYELENAIKFTAFSFGSDYRPITTNLEARITHKFKFPVPVLNASLKCSIDIANFNFTNVVHTNVVTVGGNGSLWASKNGLDWKLLMIAEPTNMNSYTLAQYRSELPIDVLGNNEIWIQARLKSTNDAGAPGIYQHFPRRMIQSLN